MAAAASLHSLSRDEARAFLAARPTISVVEAGELLGLARGAAYRAANDPSGTLGRLVLHVGGKRRVPTARLEAILFGEEDAA